VEFILNTLSPNHDKVMEQYLKLVGTVVDKPEYKEFHGVRLKLFRKLTYSRCSDNRVEYGRWWQPKVTDL
jgi:hypothetical protein